MNYNEFCSVADATAVISLKRKREMTAMNALIAHAMSTDRLQHQGPILDDGTRDSGLLVKM